MNDVVCAGCGWTHDKSENYKKGISIVQDTRENRMLALKTYEKENRFFRQAIVISLLVIPFVIAITYYFQLEFENALYLVGVIILLCASIIAVCINGIMYTEKQYKEYISNEEEQKETIRPSNMNVEVPQKFVPTSGMNIRRRMVGFLFGASIPILALFEMWPSDRFVEKYFGNWKYILYIIIIFGLIGFIFGDKYYNNIINIWRRIKKEQ